MKKLLIFLLSAFSLAAVAQQKPKIAVYMTGDDPINEIVSNRLVDDFARGNEYTTVERTASFLAELSKEHAYERSGEVDDEQIAALGRQFNVQYVCVVSVLDVWNTEKYITARIIDTETAEVIASCSSNGSIQNSSELIGALNTLSESFIKAMRSSKQDNAKKVAVYVSKTGNRDVDIVLGDQLVSGFARSGRYVAIERTNSFLKKLKDEQGYQQSGAVADDDLTRWGQQFGVQYVCIAKSTSWAGDYFITTRMVDVKTGEVVNSFTIEGEKMTNSAEVVEVAQEIATELSKGTLAEQAEEARIKSEKEERIRIETEARLKAEREEREARLKAEREEQERLIAEQEARKRALEEERQRRRNDTIAQIEAILKQGYVLVETELGKYLVDLTIKSETSFKDAKTTYNAHGMSGWRLPTEDEFNVILFGEDRGSGQVFEASGMEYFLQLFYKYKKLSIFPTGTYKYWCISKEKHSFYKYIECRSEIYGLHIFTRYPDQRDYGSDFGALIPTHIKSSIVAKSFYVIKL